jgi:Fe2+ or Zn2+ uptake regulation protein
LFTFTQPESKCPSCGVLLNQCTNFFDSGGPSEGDLIVCSDCGQILEFTTGLAIVAISEETLDEMAKTMPNDISIVRRMRALIRS